MMSSECHRFFNNTVINVIDAHGHLPGKGDPTKKSFPDALWDV